MTSFPFPSDMIGPDVNATGGVDLDEAWRAILDQTFTPKTEPLISLGLSGESSLSLGNDPFKFNVGISGRFGSRLRLFWPDTTREKDPTLDVSTIVPDFDQQPANGTGPLALLLALDGTAEMKAAAPPVTAGAFSAKFGIKTGAQLGYARLVHGQQSETARALLERVFRGLQLPQSINAPLAVGETVALSYGGSLSFTSVLTWGYELSGTQRFDLGELSGSIAYAAKLGPRLTVTAGLSGEFRFQAVGIPAQPGWVRLSVHKAGDRFAGAALDFGATVSYDVEGLDRSFYETVGMLFGLDPQSIAKAIQQAGDLTSIDGLRSAAGDLLKNEIDALVAKWVPQGIAATDFTMFAARLGRAANAYAGLESHVHAFLADNDNVGQSTDTLVQKIAEHATPANLAQALGNAQSPFWQKLSAWFGPQAEEWLAKLDPASAATKALAELQDQVLAATDAGVHDLIAVIDPAGKARDLLDKLRAIQNPEQVAAIVDEQIEALIAQLLEQPFAELAKNQHLVATLAKLQDVVGKIEKLQQDWPEIVKKAAHGKFTAEFTASYKRATSNDRLLSARFNLDPTNPKYSTALRLYKKALEGDFTVLLNEDPDLVKLERGQIETKLSRETTLGITIFGQSATSSFKLTQESTLALENGDSGQIAVDTTRTAAQTKNTSSWFGDRESKMSELALLMSAPLVTDASGGRFFESHLSLGVTYDVSLEDSETSPAELREYLDFAQQLGLTTSAEQLADSITELTGGGPNLGKLTAKYAVSLAPKALQEVFTHIEPAEINWFGRIARRRYYGRRYLAQSKKAGRRVLGRAYNYIEDSTGKPVGMTVHQQNIPDVGFYNDTLRTLLKTENDTIQALIAFDDAMDDLRQAKKSDAKSLKAAALALLKARGAADIWLPANFSAFFAILDALAHYAVGNKGGLRQSRLTLALTPPGGAAPINLILTA